MPKRSFNSDSCGVKWIGEKIGVSLNDSFYSEFEWNNVVYCIGDCVVLNEHHMGMILHLWENERKECMAEVKLYIKYEDLPKSKKFQLDEYYGDGDSDVHGKEICWVLETDEIDEFHLSDIRSKIQIHYGICEHNKENETPNNHVHYHCRVFYSYRAKAIRILNSCVDGKSRHRSTFSKREKQISHALALFSEDQHVPVSKTCSIEKIRNACQQFQLSTIPKEILGRENEQKELFHLLSTTLKTSGGGRCIYISGLPGTGKSLTYSKVIEALKNAVLRGELPDFQVIDINVLKLRCAEDVYSVLYREMNGSQRKLSNQVASELLEREFNFPSNPQRKHVVLLLEEIDFMMTKSHSIFYNLFNWPTLPHSKFCVVGIANTMDLPERLPAKIQSRMGLHRFVFPPYTRDQIEAIILDRMKKMDIFEPGAISLFSKSIANCSGDIREALQLSQRAAEICLKRASQEIDYQIRVADVHQARKEMHAAPSMLAIASLPKYVCWVLVAIAQETGATSGGGGGHIDLDRIVLRVRTLASTHGDSNQLRYADIQEMCCLLHQMGIVCFEQNKRDRQNALRLSMSVDEIAIALKNNPIGFGLL